ncbi:metallophosphoesterase [uncultured Sphingomonas sp.]|uniref:metallophosphoesterase n=1 Tax=uncultured Sphingomonas sp. TaxID=158754 RepID=UPI0025E4E0BA|nr:metallophosphoesterase [uncultured Sphingomonas sp.]
MKRRIGWIAAAAAVAGVTTATIGYRNALADPIVRSLHLPAPIAPTSIVLMTDSHVAGPDMPPERLARIVAQVNALKPDLVLLAGDYVSDKAASTGQYDARAAIAPFAALRPRLGTIAVLGNHDHERGAAEMRRALQATGIVTLANNAVRAGPLAIGGLDDATTDHADLPATLAALRRIGGVPVLLSHNPDPFKKLSGKVGLMLAGHTHCGQVRLPILSALTYGSNYGARYGCGVVRERGRVLVVGAGLGTSELPIRFGTPPDLWRITIGG